jgi:TonB-linked SusC/RagA family outer membrane protein
MTDEWTQASRSGYLSSNLDIINAGATANQLTEGSASQYRRRSIVGRVSYDYDNRYLLEFNSRYDGSDLFDEGKQFGFFPAFSAGWVVSKEKFMQNVSFINNLKIRGSYGTLGNDRIDAYQYLTFYSFGSGASIGLPPSSFQNNIYLSRMANKDVTWEKSKKTDIGIESRFLHDFSLEVDLFWEKRDNILGKRNATIPSYVGINSDQMPFENFEKIDNHGIEITAGYNKQFSNGLNLQTRIDITSTRNKVIDIGEAADVPARLKQEGRPLNSMYGLIALGLFQSEQQIIDAYGADYMNERGLKPGDIYFKDLNGDKRIDDQDRTYIGNYNVPKAVFGFNSILSYKGFEFSMFWQAATGGEQFLSIWMAQPFVSGGKALVAHQDYWRPDNTHAKYPRVTTQSNWNYGEDPNTFWLYNMSYLRLKNAEIAYSLPKKWINKAYMQNLRVYCNAVNLLTFSAYKEIDPEIGSDFGNGYPQSIVYNFGVQITF